METVVYYLLSAIAALIALTVHEYCHGYAAYKLGDDTAKNFGRLTLNPLKHIDPYGAICMVLFHIGWAKPVPVNARNFKNPKKDFAITAAAGPLSNLILGFFSALLYLVVLTVASNSDIEFKKQVAAVRHKLTQHCRDSVSSHSIHGSLTTHGPYPILKQYHYRQRNRHIQDRTWAVP